MRKKADGGSWGQYGGECVWECGVSVRESVYGDSGRVCVRSASCGTVSVGASRRLSLVVVSAIATPATCVRECFPGAACPWVLGFQREGRV